MNKEIKIGKYTPKDKFLEFVGTRGNIQFISDEAIIEAKYLSGLDMDDIYFKLSIRDEGTVDFDEIETNKTTEEQRGRLLDIISEKTISPFNKKMVITELPFKSTKKVNDKEVDLYLVVDYQKPIEKLASIFDSVDVSDDQHTKIDDFLTSLGIDFNEEEKVEDIVEPEEKLEEVKISNSTSALEDTFKKLKEEKVAELKKQLAHQKTEAKRFEYEKSQAEKKLSVAENDIKVLQSRIESLEPVKESNGYYFFVSEQINEKITLDEATTKIIIDKISKVKGINVPGFMKLFEQGEFQIKIGKKDADTIVEVTDYTNLPQDIKDSLQSEIGIFMNQENNLVYVGDLKWHDIVGKFIKNGFTQEPEFDKICGSNSYSVGKFATESTVEHKCSDDNCCPKNDENNKNNNMSKFKKLASFNKPTDIVIIGHSDDIGDDFKVTDDESAFDLYVDGKPYKDGKRTMTLGCFGFGSVLTLEEFKNMDLSEVVEDGEDSIVEGVIVQNFVGEVGIGAVTDSNDIITDFDIDDYIQHQVDDYCDVVINIPSGFNIVKLNGDLSLPTSVIRDVKIESVLNK